MNYSFQRELLSEGVYFSSVTDDKFKHNRITANFILPLNKNTVTNNAVVPFILRKGYRECPDFTKLNRELNRLYGASLSCDISKFGAYQVLDISIYGVDDRYTLEKESIVQKCAQMLSKVLLDQHFENGLLPQKDVELEKQYLIDTIESQINDKRIFALNRCKTIMCEGESLAVEKYGYIEDAKKITSASATEAYKNILKTAQVEIMFVGCGNPDAAKQVFKQAFSSVERFPISIKKPTTKTKADEIKEVTDEMDVSQSKLVMGFRCGEINSMKEFYAVRTMAALFGGTPNSRLFTYVREKLSLCYYCAARFDRMTGLMMVDSGVNKENKQKAYDEILNQLEVIKNGDFSDDELIATRLAMKNSLQGVTDSLGAIEEWYMAQIMSGTDIAPGKEAEALDNVTKEDVIAAAKKVTLDTVYFLTGKEEQ